MGEIVCVGCQEMDTVNSNVDFLFPSQRGNNISQFFSANNEDVDVEDAQTVHGNSVEI